jgi:hypothetical protein
VKELLRQVHGDNTKRAFALGLPVDILDDDKPTPTRRSTTATGDRNNFPAYPSPDHPAMVAWRRNNGVSRAEHIRLLERHGIGKSGVVRPTPGLVDLR